MSSAAQAEPAPPRRRRVVVGTAGHIDHGKTQLIRALTGTDCDRWAEEKERGITIDIGFAHLVEGDLQVGFVDVPGHERFLHNALAGLGGIRIAMLVVAASEGVMPQTREHLAICSLLEIPSAIVALTKVDLVTDDLAELAELEVGELLESTPFAGAPIVRVSSQTGEGVEALRAALVNMADGHEIAVEPGSLARLPIDRAFHLPGLGVLVTGTLISGTIEPRQDLELLPAGRSVRVRGVQVHGEARDRASAGERTSLQLGGVELVELHRGMQIVTPGAFSPSGHFGASFTLLGDAPEPLTESVEIRIHLYSGEVLGRLRPLDPPVLEPGDTGQVELRLYEPMVAVRGDRFIVRRPSPAHTLGGGRILDPRWLQRRGAALSTALQSLASGRLEALELWVASAREKGIGADDLARRVGSAAETVVPDLETMTEGGTLLEIPQNQGQDRRWIARSTLDGVKVRAQEILEAYFARDPMALGVPKGEAVERVLPRVPKHLARTYFDWLEGAGVLTYAGELVTLPGRKVQLGEDAQRLIEEIGTLYEDAGFEPPTEDELAEHLGDRRKGFRIALRYLTDTGRLRRLPNGATVAQSILDGLYRDVRGEGWERFTVPQFKERFGLSRKWAIPLLEHLDSIGVTRRVGNERVLFG